VSITRCANLYGPGDVNWDRLVPGTIRALLGGVRPVIRSDGSPTRDYLYVDDAARAVLRLAEAMADGGDAVGEAFNFSAEAPTTVLELVDALQRAIGSDLAPDIRNDAVSEIPHQHLSAEKARRVLGWKATTTMAQALPPTVEWYRALLAARD
jgi:CDP-glucose 4,6-dehydratase